MKAKVLKAYTDRLDAVVHLAGDVVELTGDRAAELAGGGYVVALAQTESGKPDYGSMSYNDLKKAAKAAGVPTTGKKADLVSALEAL